MLDWLKNLWYRLRGRKEENQGATLDEILGEESTWGITMTGPLRATIRDARKVKRELRELRRS